VVMKNAYASHVRDKSSVPNFLLPVKAIILGIKGQRLIEKLDEYFSVVLLHLLGYNDIQKHISASIVLCIGFAGEL
jgi:hypothetical protein